jgi:hypothetical protein
MLMVLRKKNQTMSLHVDFILTGYSDVIKICKILIKYQKDEIHIF